MHRRALKKSPKRVESFWTAFLSQMKLVKQNKWGGMFSALISISLLVSVMSLVFAVRYDASFLMVVVSIPIAVILGCVLFVLEKYLALACTAYQDRAGRLHAGFLSFFLYIIGSGVAFSLLLSLPMGVFFRYFASPELLSHFGRWAVNLSIVVALAGWLARLIPGSGRYGKYGH